NTGDGSSESVCHRGARCGLPARRGLARITEILFGGQLYILERLLQYQSAACWCVAAPGDVPGLVGLLFRYFFLSGFCREAVARASAMGKSRHAIRRCRRRLPAHQHRLPPVPAGRWISPVGASAAQVVFVLSRLNYNLSRFGYVPEPAPDELCVIVNLKAN